MSVSKRAFDLLLGLCLVGLLFPALAGVAVAILLMDGRPVFYVSERMKTPKTGFQLVKFRTMTCAQGDHGVSGGDKSDRITRIGRFLRRTRLDELPQLWNILRGDMSFVGPRPPLREYVEQFPDVYSQVLKSRPGVTGLATLKFHKHEEFLLAQCQTSEETDACYTQRCIPRKARLDLLYQTHRTLGWDIGIMAQTVLRVLK